MLDALAPQDVERKNVPPSVPFVVVDSSVVHWHIVYSVPTAFLAAFVPHMVQANPISTKQAHIPAASGLQTAAPLASQHKIDTFPSAVIMDRIHDGQ